MVCFCCFEGLLASLVLEEEREEDGETGMVTDGGDRVRGVGCKREGEREEGREDELGEEGGPGLVRGWTGRLNGWEPAFIPSPALPP